ncbi:MAG: hypothetical protein ACRDKZ_02000, partial [Actinomycetota bacterium]
MIVLTVTDQASTAIKGLIEQSEVPDGGLRIFAEPLEGDQASLELALTPSPGPGDEVMDSQGALIYLETNAAAFLTDKVLDAALEGDGVRFSINEQGTDP